MADSSLLKGWGLVASLALCVTEFMVDADAFALDQPTIPAKVPLFATNPIHVRSAPSFVGEAVSNLQGKNFASFEVVEGTAVEFTGETSENLRPGKGEGVWIVDDSMQLTWYQLLVLTGEHRGKRGWVQNKRLKGKPIRIKVAIFLVEPDGAFDDAAKTSLKKWEESCRESLEQKSASRKPMVDWYRYIPVSSPSKLATAWKSINEALRTNDAFVMDQQSQVLEVHLFTHASYDNLEYDQKSGDSGFADADLQQLERLQWPKDSERTTRVFLHGCNTGVQNELGRAPAQILADQQSVGVQGELGFSYFSSTADYYKARDTKGGETFLKAFNRGKNRTTGDGKAIEPVVALPATSPKDNEP